MSRGFPPGASSIGSDGESEAGGVAFDAFARIDRCAATNVNPVTAERDLIIPLGLQQAYGHPDCGIYLKVVDGGKLQVGEEIGPIGD